MNDGYGDAEYQKILEAEVQRLRAKADAAFVLGRRYRDVEWREAALGYQSDGVIALVREMREACPVIKTDD